MHRAGRRASRQHRLHRPDVGVCAEKARICRIPQIAPACALADGYLLVLVDALARTVIEPRELPVGVLTALLGVPMMLWLLSRP